MFTNTNSRVHDGNIVSGVECRQIRRNCSRNKYTVAREINGAQTVIFASVLRPIVSNQESM